METIGLKQLKEFLNKQCYTSCDGLYQEFIKDYIFLEEELDKIIADEGLNKDETYNFIQRSFDKGRVETNGVEVSNILPPMNMFTPNNERQEKKNKVIDKLLEFFDKFFSITSK